MYNDYMRNIDNIFTTELVNDGIYYNETIQIQLLLLFQELMNLEKTIKKEMY